ncbi:MAG: LUD domain-containing protein [Natronomonas sp.]
MSTDLVSQFTDAALKTVDSCTRTDSKEFETTLSELVVEPAVGAPLSSDAVSLDGTTVDTDPSVEALDNAETGVAQAGAAMADYGTITVESRPGGDELVSLYPPRHIVVLDANDIVPDVSTAFDHFETAIRDARAEDTAGASRVLATGPSATGDMGELVKGVHGPKEVHIVVIEA